MHDVVRSRKSHLSLLGAGTGHSLDSSTDVVFWGLLDGDPLRLTNAYSTFQLWILGLGDSHSRVATSSSSSSSLTTYQQRGLIAIYHMLTWFASTQIRNVACLGGNIVTASPISDMNPMLSCLNAELNIASLNGNRNILVKNFFKGYRQVYLNNDEILQDIYIPFTKEFEFVIPLKQARRREDDISIVTSGNFFFFDYLIL